MEKKSLEERLIDFAVSIVKLVEALPNTYLAKHFGGQLVRSGSSPALNYAEARSAESAADFVHKMSICLKELRETQVNLKIIERCNLATNELISFPLREVNELISIFVASIATARNNLKNKSK